MSTEPVALPEEDEALLARARKLKRDAVQQVLVNHYPRAYRLARALAGREDVARGVVRFVMHRAVRLMPTFRDPGEPARWFNHHTVLTARRAEKHVPAAMDDLLVKHAPAAEAPYVAFVKALRLLEFQQREAFVLRQLEQLELRQTAVAMDCSAEAARNHLSAAENALRTMAGAEFEQRLGQMRQAYVQLSPGDQSLLPTARRYAIGYLWPRRIKRLAVAGAILLLGLMLLYLWQNGWFGSRL